MSAITATGDVMKPWCFIAGPCPLNAKGMQLIATGLRLARELRLIPSRSRFVSAPMPQEAAMEIRRALLAGERVVLANGPWQLGATLGDPHIDEALTLLRDEIPPGIIVGGFHHAHALTDLALRSSSVKAYVAPPFAELLVTDHTRHLVDAALRSIAQLGGADERLLQRPCRSHVGYARPAARSGSLSLPGCRKVAATILQPGEARGPILAGNLLTLSFGVARWGAALNGAILAVEVAGAQLRMIDRYLQRLMLLGVFDQIGALLVGAPFDLICERPTLRLADVVLRAVHKSKCVTVLDAFVGCGLPGTCMRIAAGAAVSAGSGGFSIAPLAQIPDHSAATA